MKTAGVRSLVDARLYGSTSRVIDVAVLLDRAIGASDAKQIRPPFFTKQLNNSIIFKHTLRNSEKPLFNDGRYSAVKIVFPFSKWDLDLGGLSLFVNERSYASTLCKFLNAYEIDDSLSHDMKLLELLDKIPSFDPFLISERAASESIDLSKGLFDLSASDSFLLRQTVANSLAEIVRVAIPDDNVNAAAGRLAASFLEPSNNKPLEPLREALRMLPGDFKEAIFSWKGILYYSWKAEDITEKFKDIITGLGEITALVNDKEWKSIIKDNSRNIANALNGAIVVVSEELMEYELVIEEVNKKGDPTRLVNFLKVATEKFSRMGDAMGLITHCLDYWLFATRGLQMSTITEQHAFDIVVGMAEPIKGQLTFLEVR